MKKRLKKRVRVNPLAKDLRTPKYHLRVVRSSKVYDRKRVPKVAAMDEYGCTYGGPMFGINF